MYLIKGAKLSKSDYINALATRIARYHNVKRTDKHLAQAQQMVKDGAYDKYLKQYKSKKAEKSESK